MQRPKKNLFSPEKMLPAITSEDDVGAVIRLHLIVEQNLFNFLARVLPNPSALKEGRDTLSRCLEWLSALGVSDDVIGPCRQLNKIRNDFAHGKAESLTHEHVN